MERATILLSEWDTRELPEGLMTAADQPLLQAFTSEESSRLHIERTWSGVRVHTRSFVGVVRFERCELRIEPKLVDGNVGLLEMIEFTTGLSALHRTAATRGLDTSGSGLFDLIALLLIDACEQLVRQGLVADYRPDEGDLPVVRGRLLVDRQVCRRFGRIDRLECRYDEHDQNIQENQLLTAALARCMLRVDHLAVRRRARRLYGLFSEVCSLDEVSTGELLAPVAYHRMNQHYQDGHELARLVIEGLGIKDLMESGSTQSFAFLIDMGRLFERFVLRLFEQILPQELFLVHYQHRRKNRRSIVWNVTQDEAYTQVAPDLLVEQRDAGRSRLPIDAKYKPYDKRQISSSDIYQTFLYAYAYGSAASQRRALIAYPASSKKDDTIAPRLWLAVRDAALAHGAELAMLGLPITALLQEVRGSTAGPLCRLLRDEIEAALAPKTAAASTVDP